MVIPPPLWLEASPKPFSLVLEPTFSQSTFTGRGDFERVRIGGGQGVGQPSFSSQQHFFWDAEGCTPPPHDKTPRHTVVRILRDFRHTLLPHPSSPETPGRGHPRVVSVPPRRGSGQAFASIFPTPMKYKIEQSGQGSFRRCHRQIFSMQ